MVGNRGSHDCRSVSTTLKKLGDTDQGLKRRRRPQIEAEMRSRSDLMLLSFYANTNGNRAIIFQNCEPDVRQRRVTFAPKGLNKL